MRQRRWPLWGCLIAQASAVVQLLHAALLAMDGAFGLSLGAGLPTELVVLVLWASLGGFAMAYSGLLLHVRSRRDPFARFRWSVILAIVATTAALPGVAWVVGIGVTALFGVEMPWGTASPSVLLRFARWLDLDGQRLAQSLGPTGLTLVDAAFLLHPLCLAALCAWCRHRDISSDRAYE